MSEVKRYEFGVEIEGCYAQYHGEESADGEYVEFAVFDRVTAERDAALGREAALIDQLDAALRQVKANWDYAEDKQQRLTAADEKNDTLSTAYVSAGEREHLLRLRVADLEGLLQMFIENTDDKDVIELAEHALKPAEPPLPEGWYGVDCEENNREPGITVRFGSGTEISSYGKCSRYLPYKMGVEIHCGASVNGVIYYCAGCKP